MRIRTNLATGAAFTAAVIAGGLFVAQGAPSGCTNPDLCEKAQHFADELRKEFSDPRNLDVYRPIDIRAEGALVVVELEVQGVWDNSDPAILAKVRTTREATRVRDLCEKNPKARSLIDSGISFRLRTVSRNGVVLNDVTITDCGGK